MPSLIKTVFKLREAEAVESRMRTADSFDACEKRQSIRGTSALVRSDCTVVKHQTTV